MIRRLRTWTSRRPSSATRPHLIWTNDESLVEERGTGASLDLSLNYLGVNLLRMVGVPLDGYYSFLLVTEQVLPVVNLNGYLDSDGVWRWHREESVSLEDYSNLAIVQYDNVFNRSRRGVGASEVLAGE